MKNFNMYALFIFCLVVASSCKKEKEDPIKERDRQESVNLLKEYLVRPGKFEVNIYQTQQDRSTGMKINKLMLTTTNDQIFFEGYYLYVYPHQLGYHIDNLGDLYAVFVSGSHTEIEKFNVKFFK